MPMLVAQGATFVIWWVPYYYPPCHSKLVPCRILEATFAAAGSHSLSPQIGAKVTSFQMVNTHKQTDFKPV